MYKLAIFFAAISTASATLGWGKPVVVSSGVSTTSRIDNGLPVAITGPVLVAKAAPVVVAKAAPAVVAVSPVAVNLAGNVLVSNGLGGVSLVNANLLNAANIINAANIVNAANLVNSANLVKASAGVGGSTLVSDGLGGATLVSNGAAGPVVSGVAPGTLVATAPIETLAPSGVAVGTAKIIG